MHIEQAIYGGQDAGGYQFLARSPGFRGDWLPAAEQLCTGFGERPHAEGWVACPEAVFARPLGPRHVAVVQAADQGRDDAGRPGALAFRLLVLPQTLYADLGGDPFFIADQFPPPWSARGELPALEWTAGSPPPRTIASLRNVLNVPHSAALLGGVQALLDGGRLVFERQLPAPELVRSLWVLLPYSTRSTLWPASFAFSNAHGFHVVVIPRAAGPEFTGYLTEGQAGDYPEGRYELALQSAVEAGDQAEVDALFARRSRAQMMRLALVLLVGFAAAALLIGPRPEPPTTTRQKGQEQEKEKPAPAAPGEKGAALHLPPPADFPTLSSGERERFAEQLQQLGGRLGIDLPAGNSPQRLSEALVSLDAALDARLGDRRPARDPGKLENLGPPARQLRALLWKHGLAEYAEMGLNPQELVERLQGKLARDGLLQEESGD